jgi:predicted RNase H-like HicB family nuclease
MIERAPSNFAAYIPDLPGCVATGKTIDEVAANVRAAFGMHLGEISASDELILEFETVVE